MPLYAGVAETNITPPPGVRLGGYAGRSSGATGTLDELCSRALVLDDGNMRIALLTADVLGFLPEMAAEVRAGVAEAIGTAPHAVLLHATHTHNGPHLGSLRAMGEIDSPYNNVLTRKLIGVARQAAADMRPAHLTYGESSAQIGINRRAQNSDGRAVFGRNYAGPVAQTVQAVCVNGADGRMFAMLFSHACHPVTLPREEMRFSADWPGAAVAALKAKFFREAEEAGVTAGCLPLYFQGCCGDIDPLRRGDQSAVVHNGAQIAEAAHTARWNAHGRLGGPLAAVEISIDLPLLPPPAAAECERLVSEARKRLEAGRTGGASEGELLDMQARLDWACECHARSLRSGRSDCQPFSVQCLNLGGVRILGFPAEMFVRYQLDFAALTSFPLLVLGHTNGCWNYLPTADEYVRGGYEIESAPIYYGTPIFSPEAEALVREAVGHLLAP